MGPNGAGKSTLGNVLMGNPRYQITCGQILFKGEDITHESTDKRSKAGMFLSFQEPLEVPGLSLESFLRSAMRQQTGKNLKIWEFHKQLKKAMDILQMDESYAQRSLNVGFSGDVYKRQNWYMEIVKEHTGKADIERRKLKNAFSHRQICLLYTSRCV